MGGVMFFLGGLFRLFGFFFLGFCRVLIISVMMKRNVLFSYGNGFGVMRLRKSSVVRILKSCGKCSFEKKVSGKWDVGEGIDFILVF